MKRTNTILAAFFLSALLLLAGYTLKDGRKLYTDLLQQWQDSAPANLSLLAKAEFASDRAEGMLNTALDKEHHFIELYGWFQRVAGQRFIEDNYSNSVVRMDNGSLTFGSVAQEQTDVTHNAQATADFAADLAQLGIPFTAVVTPQKAPQHTESVPDALRDYHNEEADQFLNFLEEAGIHTVDIRDDMGPDLTDCFFVTDHHWNMKGAFLGNRIMTRQLAEEYGFTPFEPGLDENQFTLSVREDFFLGSQGKRVGTKYAGMDDFVTWHPTFETSLTYRFSDQADPRVGTMAEVMYFDWYMDPDCFIANPYASLSGGDLARATAVNHLNPDGPTVVMIRDSFACALTPFFALQCGTLITIDLRAYTGDDLLKEIAELSPDLVLTLYNPGTLSSDNMFEF